MFIRYSILAVAFLAGAVVSESVSAQNCSSQNCVSGGYVVYPQSSNVIYNNCQPGCGSTMYVGQPMTTWPVYSGQVVTTSQPVSVSAAKPVPFGPQRPTDLTATEKSAGSIKTAPPLHNPVSQPGQWTSGPVFPAPGGC